jgi:predicted AAA+ superfamily ATPase
VVAIELLRRKSYWFKEWEIYYWKNAQQNEVDFVIKEGPNVRQLIQVTYASGMDEVERKEIRSLIKALNQLDCRNLQIITCEYEDEIKLETE